MASSRMKWKDCVQLYEDLQKNEPGITDRIQNVNDVDFTDFVFSFKLKTEKQFKEEVQAVHEVLKISKRLENLSLSNWSLPEIDFKFVLDVFADVELASLYINRARNISPEGWLILGRLVKQSGPKKLDAYECGARAEHVEKLAEGMDGAKLDELYIGGNDKISPEGWMKLGQLVKQSGLKTMNAVHCHARAEHIEKLVEGMDGAKLDELCIRGNDKISPEGWMKLGQLVKQSGLKKLNAGYCDARAEHIEKLVEGMDGAKLDVLTIFGNDKISPEGWMKLGQLVKQSGLKTLNAGCCDARAEHIEKLVEGMDGAKLDELNIGWNDNISPEGWMNLGKLVKQSELKTLDAECCDARAEHLEKLVEGMDDAKLDFLDLSDWIWEPPYTHWLLELLPLVNRQLNLSGWNISEDGEMELQEKLNQECLTTLKIKLRSHRSFCTLQWKAPPVDLPPTLPQVSNVKVQQVDDSILATWDPVSGYGNVSYYILVECDGRRLGEHVTTIDTKYRYRVSSIKPQASYVVFIWGFTNNSVSKCASLGHCKSASSAKSDTDSKYGNTEKIRGKKDPIKMGSSFHRDVTSIAGASTQSSDEVNIDMNLSKRFSVQKVKGVLKEKVTGFKRLFQGSMHSDEAFDPDRMKEFILPMETSEDVEKNEKLLEDEENVEHLVSSLVKLEELEAKDLVWLIMKRLFTNELAITFDWEGKKGKNAFCKLKMAGVIQKVGKRNNILEEKTEDFITEWLERADVISEKQQKQEKQNILLESEDIRKEVYGIKTIRGQERKPSEVNQLSLLETSLYIKLLSTPQYTGVFKYVVKSLSSGKVISASCQKTSAILEGINPGDKYSVFVYEVKDISTEILVAKDHKQTSKIIGNDGGYVEVEGCRLDFPPKAVDKESAVEVCKYVEDAPCIPEEYFSITPVMNFCSSQKIFKEPVTCTLRTPYLQVKNQLDVEILCFEDQRWQNVSSSLLTEDKTVIFKCRHFSPYVLVLRCRFAIAKTIPISFSMLTKIYCHREDNFACLTCLDYAPIEHKHHADMVSRGFFLSPIFVKQIKMKVGEVVSYNLGCLSPVMDIREWEVIFDDEFADVWAEIISSDLNEKIEGKSRIKLQLKLTHAGQEKKYSANLQYPLTGGVPSSLKGGDYYAVMNMVQGGNPTINTTDGDHKVILQANESR